MNAVVIVILSIVAVVDLWLVFTKRPTISQRWQALFPTYVDLFILCLLIPGIVVLGVSIPLKVILAVLGGHVFFPNKERYGSVVRHVYVFRRER